jgi:hypothetical protein
MFIDGAVFMIEAPRGVTQKSRRTTGCAQPRMRYLCARPDPHPADDVRAAALIPRPIAGQLET